MLLTIKIDKTLVCVHVQGRIDNCNIDCYITGINSACAIKNTFSFLHAMSVNTEKLGFRL